MTKRCARLSVAVGFAILFCLRLPNLTVTQDEQLNGSRWTLEAPSSTLLPSVEPPAAFNRSENNTFPSGAASYLNDTRPALLQTNKFFSSFLDEQLNGSRWTLEAPSSTLLPSVEPPAAFNRSENNTFPSGAASYLNDTRPALLQTNKFFSSFLDEQLNGSRWTLEAPSSTLLPSVEPPAAFNRSENNTFPSGAASYLNDTRPALLQTNKFFSSFLDEQLNGSRWTLEAPSSTLLPSVEPPAAFNRSENSTFPSGAASYLNDTRPALLQTNKFFSSFLDEQLNGSRWTLEAPSSTLLPSVEPPAAFNRSENNTFPSGAASYLNDTRPALLQTNKFFSSFLDEQLNGSRWTLEAPSSTLLPSVEPPAAFNRSENNIFPSGAASYLNDTRPALLQTNKFFSSFLTTIPAALTPTPAPVVASGAYLDSPAIIPGTVEVFRLDEDVNSKPTPTSGFYEGRTASGESTRYTVYVQIDGTRNSNRSLLLSKHTCSRGHALTASTSQQPPPRRSCCYCISPSEAGCRELVPFDLPEILRTSGFMGSGLEESNPRRRRPLRPMTPFGVDLPEDRPSAVRLRNAAHYAAIRRHQESDAKQTQLEVGRDLHEKIKWEHARKAKRAKREAALRRQVVQAAIADEKLAKAAKAEKERDAFKKEYAKALADRQRGITKKKENIARELAERRSDMYDRRERRLMERALEAHATRTEARMIF